MVGDVIGGFGGGQHCVGAATDRLIGCLIGVVGAGEVVGFHEAPETPLAA